MRARIGVSVMPLETRLTLDAFRPVLESAHG
jgi:hypothetical protein